MDTKDFVILASSLITDEIISMAMVSCISHVGVG